jgi:hypothetical protein
VLAGITGLHAALKSVGHEREMDTQQYHDAAAVTLAAVGKLRIRNMSKDGPKPDVSAGA